MKKVMTFLLCVVLVCILATAAFAAYENSVCTLTAPTTELSPGDTFTVTAVLTNSESMRLAAVALNFDDTVLELTGGACLAQNAMLGQVVVPQKAGTFILNAETVTGGDLFAFEFKVKDNAPCGTYEIGNKAALGISSSSYITAVGLSVNIHSYGEWANDASNHKAVCSACGDEKIEAHSFVNYISDNNATCLADGTKTAKCDCCEATDCLTDTGSALGHSFTEYVSDNNATCLSDGTKTAKCDRCEATDCLTDTGSALGHSFTDYIDNGDATCLEDGTKTAKCDRCEGTDTIPNVDSAKGHNYADKVCANCGAWEATPGDIDGNEEITTQDAIDLLLYIAMPDMFPIEAEADFNGDGEVSTDDAIQLLLHIAMPDIFPLETKKKEA